MRSHPNNEVWGRAFAGLPDNKSYPLQRPRNEGQLRSLGGLDQVQSGRRIDAEGQGTESDTGEDAQKPEEIMKDFGSCYRTLDLSLRAMEHHQKVLSCKATWP